MAVGPRFFQGFNQWPNVQYIVGLNQNYNGTFGRSNLLAQVEAFCDIVDPSHFYAWEFGNEADLFAHIFRRPPTWDEQNYVQDWLNGTRAIAAEVENNAACASLNPAVFDSPSFGLYGPPYSNLNAVKVAQDGINQDGNVVLWSLHL